MLYEVKKEQKATNQTIRQRITSGQVSDPLLKLYEDFIENDVRIWGEQNGMSVDKAVKTYMDVLDILAKYQYKLPEEKENANKGGVVIKLGADIGSALKSLAEDGDRKQKILSSRDNNKAKKALSVIDLMKKNEKKLRKQAKPD